VPFVEADFADVAAPECVVAAALEALGSLDILVANHARSGHGRLAELTAAEIDAFLHENVRASLLLVREFAVRHDDSREGGRVVLMTSGQHLAPMAREVAYAVSKGALQQATLTLADELAQRRITVNTVNPGPTDTGWGLAGHSPAQTMPFGRWASRTTQRGLLLGFAATTRAGSPVRRSTPKAASVGGPDSDIHVLSVVARPSASGAIRTLAQASSLLLEPVSASESNSSTIALLRIEYASRVGEVMAATRFASA